ncbi:MAG: precorrin-4 C(11)-methyltransferase [Candidatus Competibacteraceae bacterium]|nr:precorrin-4 C(11)-methyltransferase [Candidatus Competibacteraceae bacterium]MCP5126765.1 precorrin-4 C(11)-methyltransferase [Gammaproteobacteria bacterium]HRX71057.1 precorrin-4 C(11)-methyltransferase [Candidatus Competibacteraceae bacterium]
MTVYFIGAGPGDPELITVKGQRLIRECPVVLYAGSLVPKEVVLAANPDARIINTADLNLDDITYHIYSAHLQGLNVARVHTGDPALYGAIGEQIRELEKRDIPYEVIPGVTAAFAGAAMLRRELTLPGVSQTIILTRHAGKTPMPKGESLPELAQHRATMAIYLSVDKLADIVAELTPHYGADCPVAVLYRISWPDQDGVVGTLTDIVEKVAIKGFTRTALILVGWVIEPKSFMDSYLYSTEHAEWYRQHD